MKNYEVISFHIKSVQLTDFPFNQIDSMACKLLFKLAHNAMIELLNEVKCSLCKHLMTHLKRQELEPRTIYEPSQPNKVKKVSSVQELIT